MTKLTQGETRKIIPDFAKAIGQRKRRTATPPLEVINFRDEKRRGKDRPVEMVPIELLLYRKDNGRIASDVLNYERENGLLDETSKEGQELLRGFLERKDVERTEQLLKAVEHSGQDDPAIITCDGFLINGNRRKMVFEALGKLHPGDEQWEYMKVVILPGPDEEGGAPTLLEIEKIENRYQLQSEGKADYYNFDRALSIKRKMELGFSLEEQLRDDPAYARASDKELKRAVSNYYSEYLGPLDCVDRYLQQFDRAGMYSLISTGQADKTGRWQAFIDYSKASDTLRDKKWQVAKDFPEEDIGTIEEAAFNIIRVRSLRSDLSGLPKVHQVMRRLPRYCAEPTARKEITRIAEEVEPVVPKEDSVDKDGKQLSLPELDAKWVQRAQQSVIRHLRKASDIVDRVIEQETPLSLLDAALKKLTHPEMQIDNIGPSEISNARQLVNSIQEHARDFEHRLYHNEKQWKSLKRQK